MFLMKNESELTLATPVDWRAILQEQVGLVRRGRIRASVQRLVHLRLQQARDLRSNSLGSRAVFIRKVRRLQHVVDGVAHLRADAAALDLGERFGQHFVKLDVLFNDLPFQVVDGLQYIVSLLDAFLAGGGDRALVGIAITPGFVLHLLDHRHEAAVLRRSRFQPVFRVAEYIHGRDHRAEFRIARIGFFRQFVERFFAERGHCLFKIERFCLVANSKNICRSPLIWSLPLRR